MDESILTTIRFLNQIRVVHKLTPEQSLAIAFAIDYMLTDLLQEATADDDWCDDVDDEVEDLMEEHDGR